MENMTQEILEKLDFLIEERTKEVFNTEEAATYLRISYEMLSRYARTKIIRSARNGKNYIFKKEWLDEWLEEGGTA